MDPLSALGVAASVAQFVQFGASLVSKSRQIYRQGALLDHIECGHATRRLTEVANDVKKSLKDLEYLGEPSSDAKELERICRNCVKPSEELLFRLEKVRLNEKNTFRKWKSLRQALKTVCMKDGVDSLSRRIADCRNELNTHLIASRSVFFSSNSTPPTHRLILFDQEEGRCSTASAE
jgi:hypothetical protein